MGGGGADGKGVRGVTPATRGQRRRSLFNALNYRHRAAKIESRNKKERKFRNICSPPSASGGGQEPGRTVRWEGGGKEEGEGAVSLSQQLIT